MADIPVNLLPWRARQKAACRHFWGRLSVVTLLVLACLIVALWLPGHLEVQRLQLLAGTDQQLLAGFVVREQRFVAHQQRQKQQQARLARQQETLRWQPLLTALAEYLPEKCWLTKLQFQHGMLEMDGVALSFAALSELEIQLGHQPGFTLRNAGKTERDPQGRWQFHYQLAQEGKDATAP